MKSAALLTVAVLGTLIFTLFRQGARAERERRERIGNQDNTNDQNPPGDPGMTERALA